VNAASWWQPVACGLEHCKEQILPGIGTDTVQQWGRPCAHGCGAQLSSVRHGAVSLLLRQRACLLVLLAFRWDC